MNFRESEGTVTDDQIATVASIISAGRLCVGWDNPGGQRRIVAVTTLDGELCGVFADGRRVPLRTVDAADIVAYFRPFADEG